MSVHFFRYETLVSRLCDILFLFFPQNFSRYTKYKFLNFFLFFKESNGMSGGVIAIVVIICLVAVAGGGVFLVVYFKRDSQIRKLLRLNSPPNTGTSSQPQSFDNLGYEAASSPSSLNETG